MASPLTLFSSASGLLLSISTDSSTPHNFFFTLLIPPLTLLFSISSALPCFSTLSRYLPFLSSLLSFSLSSTAMAASTSFSLSTSPISLNTGGLSSSLRLRSIDLQSQAMVTPRFTASAPGLPNTDRSRVERPHGSRLGSTTAIGLSSLLLQLVRWSGPTGVVA